MGRGVTGFDGAALRDARRQASCPYHQHALTADCLARIVGTSKALILSYEHGRSSPSPQRLQELAFAVERHPSVLQRSLPQLSDLRVAAGFTAAEMANRLNLAVNTYRRIETEGLMPRRRPGVIWELIRSLGVDYTRVRAALSQIPAVQERRMQAALTLAPLLAQTRRPGEFLRLQDTSVEARHLASLYEARPAAVSKLVNLQIGEVRQLLSRRAQVQARLDFAHSVPSRFLRTYKDDIALLDEEIRRTEDDIPDVLEQYLVHPLSQRCWVLLTKLYTAGPGGLNLSPSNETLMALERVFDQYLIDRNPSSARPEFAVQLSTQGTLFCIDTLPYYRALYHQDRVIRPYSHYYGWPSIDAERRPQLRAAHVMGYDPYPHWRQGDRIIPASRSNPPGSIPALE